MDGIEERPEYMCKSLFSVRPQMGLPSYCLLTSSLLPLICVNRCRPLLSRSPMAPLRERRSPRQADHDYTQSGLYFVTACTARAAGWVSSLYVMLKMVSPV